MSEIRMLHTPPRRRRRSAFVAGCVPLILASLAHAQSPTSAPSQAPLAAPVQSAPAPPAPAPPVSAAPASPGQATAGQASAGQAGAAPRVMSLDDALALAEEQSETITIAKAGVDRSSADEMRARSELMPQLNGVASYDRALASEFEDVFNSLGPSCTPLTVNPAAPIDQRVSEIERALKDCPPSGSFFGGGSDSGDSDNTLPFGQRNTVRLTLNFSQNLYNGGRIKANRERARLNRVNADLNVTSIRAQLYFDVATAYYDSALSDRLVMIAEETLAQAGRTFDQTKAQREAGRMAEFDLLRAQVTRDTQRPQVIRARNARDLAYLRLKQLLNLPANQALQLTVRLDEELLPQPSTRFSSAMTDAEAGLPPRERTAVTQATNTVESREADVRIAHAQRLPAVNLTTSYSKVGYPSSFSTLNDFRTNSTIGVAMSVPIFNGGRIKADELTARAGVTETTAQLQLTRELAQLDMDSARLDVSSARAAWDATSGTIQQAVRAYEIAELRYREGLSTQLELSDSRLLLQQAQANRAQAARDVQVARVRLALLPDLPLAATSGAQAQARTAGVAQTQTSTASTTTNTQPQTAGQTGAGTQGTTGRTGAQP